MEKKNLQGNMQSLHESRMEARAWVPEAAAFAVCKYQSRQTGEASRYYTHDLPVIMWFHFRLLNLEQIPIIGNP